MALGLIAVLFVNCSNDPTLRLETSKITKLTGDTIRIFTETGKVSVDSSLSNTLAKEEEIMWAYQNPGEKIEYDSDVNLNYSSKSFWTESTITKKVTLISYNKEQGKIISEKFTTEKTKTDLLSLFLFLILFSALIVNVFGKDDKDGNFLFFVLIIFNFVLSINTLGQVNDSIFQTTILAAIATFIILIVYVVLHLLFEGFKANKIPMPYQPKKIASLVLAYALTCAIRFIYFADLPVGVLHWVFLVFLSPYIIAWTIMIIKAIIKKRKVKTI